MIHSVALNFMKKILQKKIFFKLKEKKFAHDIEIVLLSGKFKVNIIGFSCKHTIVVKKEFNKQTVILLPGGPHSTDPIFLDEKFNYKRKFLLKE